MTLGELQKIGKDIWGEEQLTLGQIIVRLGKIYGDICRWERNYQKDSEKHTDSELKKELGNVIFATIKFCDALGYDPNQSVRLGIECQKQFKNSDYEIGDISQKGMHELLGVAYDIWGDEEKVTLQDYIVVIGKVLGDICRWERNAPKDSNTHTHDELKKEMGNLIFSTIKFAGRLNYDPEECVNLAIECQREGKDLLKIQE